MRLFPILICVASCAGSPLPEEGYRSRQQHCIDVAVGRVDAGTVTREQGNAEATTCRASVQRDYGRGTP